ncbi:MAG: hypothetical protein ABW051_04045, partial [Burkholderiaceae bacterium]
EVLFNGKPMNAEVLDPAVRPRGLYLEYLSFGYDSVSASASMVFNAAYDGFSISTDDEPPGVRHQCGVSA